MSFEARAIGVAMAIALVAPSARAQEPETNRALAADLFDAGVRKMDRGRCEEPDLDVPTCEAARDDFRRATLLYPAGLGALRNLAYVEKGLHLVATAARDFRELARRAPLDPDPKRRLWADFARREADALDPRIPRVRVETTEARASITLDGTALPKAAWGALLDVDPGTHAVHAEAPGCAPIDTTFTIAEQETKALPIVLAPRPAPAPRPALTLDVHETPPLEPAPPQPSRLAPMITMGAGAAFVTAGLVLGYVAIQKKQSACGDATQCDPDELASGLRMAHASTIVTGAGVAAIAGGLAWYLLTPRAKPTEAARLAPYATPGGFGVQGELRF